MTSRPLPLFDGLSSRCFVHPEIYHDAQSRFDALKVSVRGLGVIVVHWEAAADFMLYDPDRTDPSESSVPAVKFTWVDDCLKAGELLPLGPYAASPYVKQKYRRTGDTACDIPSQPLFSPARKMLRSGKSDVRFVDLSRSSSDDIDWVQVESTVDKIPTRNKADSLAPASYFQPNGRTEYPAAKEKPESLLNGTLPPPPPQNIQIGHGGRLLAHANFDLLAWYVRYVDWALALQPTRRLSYLSRDVAILVPCAKARSLLTFVRNSSHPVARKLKQTIGAANRRNLSDSGNGKSIVDKILQDFARGRVDVRKLERQRKTVGPVEGTSKTNDKEDLGASSSDTDPDEGWAMPIRRRPVKLVRLPKGSPSTKLPEPDMPRSSSFREQHKTLKRPRVVTSSSSSDFSPSPPQSKRRCTTTGGRNVPIPVKTRLEPRWPYTDSTYFTQTPQDPFGITKRRSSRTVHSWMKPQTIDSEMKISDEEECDESESEDCGPRLLEFRPIRHVFRHYSVAPKPPPRDTIDNEDYIVDEGWDRWFLSFIDWALEHDPSHNKLSVYIEMSDVTKLHRVAFANMGHRLHDQVTAAFNRVRGNNRPMMDMAMRLETHEKPYIFEEYSDGSPGASEMEIESDTEQREHKDERATSEECEEIPLTALADLLGTKVGQDLTTAADSQERTTLPVPDTPEPWQARRVRGEPPDAAGCPAPDGTTQDQPQPFENQASKLDEHIENEMALLISWTSPEKMHCVWEGLSMLFPGSGKSKEDWQRLYDRMQPAIDARAQELKATGGGEYWKICRD